MTHFFTRSRGPNVRKRTMDNVNQSFCLPFSIANAEKCKGINTVHDKDLAWSHINETLLQLKFVHEYNSKRSIMQVSGFQICVVDLFQRTSISDCTFLNGL